MTWATLNNLAWIALAATAVLSIARMNGTTRHCIRAAIVLILVGSLGQGLGNITSQWDLWLDNLLQLGLFLLLVFNVRYRRKEAP